MSANPPVEIVMVGKLTGAELKGAVDFANGAATGEFTGSKDGAAASGAASSSVVPASSASEAAAASASAIWSFGMRR